MAESSDMDELIASIKHRSSLKKQFPCIPLPIGSYLQPQAKEMRFGRQETFKSETSAENDRVSQASFRPVIRLATERKGYQAG